MRGRALPFLLSLGVLGACTLAEPPEPRLTTLAPASVWTHETQVVTVAGENFRPGAEADFEDPSDSGTQGVFRLSLAGTSGEHALTQVQWVSATELRGTLPGGLLSAGRFGLHLEDPSGGTAWLPNALEARAAQCLEDSDCDDGDPCTVGERCEAFACMAGAFTPDRDGDGFAALACGGSDCDDDPLSCGAACSPGVAEISESCSDGRDNDCDGAVDSSDGVCAGTCTLLEPALSSDSTLSQAQPEKNEGSKHDFDVKGEWEGGERRGLVGFEEVDCSDDDDPPSVSRATLLLKAGPGSLGEVTMHALSVPWVEDDVTWSERQLGTPWATAGGDFDAGVLASATARPGLFLGLDALGAFGATCPSGVVLVGTPETDARFWSAESDPEDRPRLVLEVCP